MTAISEHRMNQRELALLREVQRALWEEIAYMDEPTHPVSRARQRLADRLDTMIRRHTRKAAARAQGRTS